MKRLALVIVLAGTLFMLNGCAVYTPPYDGVGLYYNYVPYSMYGYGGNGFYGHYSFRPRFYGGWGHGWGGGWRGRGWRGRGWH